MDALEGCSDNNSRIQTILLERQIIIAGMKRDIESKQLLSNGKPVDGMLSEDAVNVILEKLIINK